jgi:thiamine biosynthesis protein ThiI
VKQLKKVIGVSFGEIALKGKNRPYFTNKLKKQIIMNLERFEDIKVYNDHSKFYVEGRDEDLDAIMEQLKKVFGIVLLTPCIRVDVDLDQIDEAVLVATKETLAKNDYKTFKAEGIRADKKFPMNSMEIARHEGGVILKNIDGLKVDVHKPDFKVFVDIRQHAYVFTEKIPGGGGLPVGCTGRGLLLLSGGIDSPVAAYMMAKRGVEINAIHFHSYPFTSERAKEKVLDLAKIISQYTGEFRIYNINLLEIQKAIHENCPEKHMVNHSRRFMMKIAETIAMNHDMKCLITGESLGQVASQTMEGIMATNSITTLPVFRPLIGMDKTEIMDIAHRIGTYETSILPFEDCCTVFLPKHPATKPSLKALIKEEEELDFDGLVKDAIDKMEIITIDRAF